MNPIAHPEPLRLSRRLNASCERIFAAWSRAESVRRWFAPEGCHVPAAEVDFRAGGRFDLTMALPDGTRHEMRAQFTVVEPHSRLGFAGELHSGGRPGFRFDTVVTLTPDGAGAILEVTQTYEIFDEAFRFAVAGAPEGWSSTLRNLEREALLAGSATHGAFTLRRAFAATPARLYRAFAELEAKARWFVGPPGFETLEREMDVRPGGRERLVGRHAGSVGGHAAGVVTAFDAVYFDVVPDQRLVYGYELRVDGTKISVSLATLTFAPDPKGALLTVTEQGAFLDGYEDAGAREHGTGLLLEAVERSLGEA